jgi:hypothetical protein
MEKSGAFALHLAGEFPGLDMEFWAVRSPKINSERKICRNNTLTAVMPMLRARGK